MKGAVGRARTAIITACLIADGDDFVSHPAATLVVDFTGIVGDIHAGLTRRSTSREPWYPRGTEIRNDRQLTVVSVDELAEAAEAMDLPRIEPGWIGANIVLDGISGLSALPAGTKLFLAGGVTLNIEGENQPCRAAGRSIGVQFPDRHGLDLLFPKAARRKRGVVASVEKPGTITVGETATIRGPTGG